MRTMDRRDLLEGFRAFLFFWLIITPFWLLGKYLWHDERMQKHYGLSQSYSPEKQWEFSKWVRELDEKSKLNAASFTPERYFSDLLTIKKEMSHRGIPSMPDSSFSWSMNKMSNYTSFHGSNADFVRARDHFFQEERKINQWSVKERQRNQDKIDKKYPHLAWMRTSAEFAPDGVLVGLLRFYLFGLVVAGLITLTRWYELAEQTLARRLISILISNLLWIPFLFRFEEVLSFFAEIEIRRRKRTASEALLPLTKEEKVSIAQAGKNFKAFLRWRRHLGTVVTFSLIAGILFTLSARVVQADSSAPTTSSYAQQVDHPIDGFGDIWALPPKPPPLVDLPDRLPILRPRWHWVTPISSAPPQNIWHIPLRYS